MKTNEIFTLLFWIPIQESKVEECRQRLSLIKKREEKRKIFGDIDNADNNV
jgi:hypothetical protein